MAFSASWLPVQVYLIYCILFLSGLFGFILDCIELKVDGVIGITWSYVLGLLTWGRKMGKRSIHPGPPNPARSCIWISHSVAWCRAPLECSQETDAMGLGLLLWGIQEVLPRSSGIHFIHLFRANLSPALQNLNIESLGQLVYYWLLVNLKLIFPLGQNSVYLYSK